MIGFTAFFGCERTKPRRLTGVFLAVKFYSTGLTITERPFWLFRLGIVAIGVTTLASVSVALTWQKRKEYRTHRSCFQPLGVPGYVTWGSAHAGVGALRS